MKRFISIIIILAMLFTLASCGDGGSKKKSKSSSYEAVVEEAMNAFKKGDADKIADLYTDLLTDHDELGEYWIDEFNDLGIEKIQNWKITDAEKWEDDVVDEGVDELEEIFDYYDSDELRDAGYNPRYDPSKLKDAVDVEVEGKFKDEDGDIGQLNVYFTLVKEGSSWKISNIELDVGY